MELWMFGWIYRFGVNYEDKKDGNIFLIVLYSNMKNKKLLLIPLLLFVLIVLYFTIVKEYCPDLYCGIQFKVAVQTSDPDIYMCLPHIPGGWTY